MQTNTDAKPWYRVRMLWLIIALPMVSVAMGMTILYFAVTTYDGLVVDDYYKQGKNINRVLRRDTAAQSHGLEGTLDIDGAQRLVKVYLEARYLKVLPARLQVSFLHTTRAGLDRVVLLEKISNGRYEGRMPELAPGHWNVQMEADDWRLVGLMGTPNETQVRLQPAAAPRNQ